MRYWIIALGCGLLLSSSTEVINPTSPPPAESAAYRKYKAEMLRWAGDYRLTKNATPLITSQQLDQLAPLLEPGDILVERRDYYLSNFGITGYWKHLALYTGDLKTLDTYFKEPSQARWQQSFSDHLQATVTAVWQQKTAPATPPRVTVEAIAEGVVLETLFESGHADSLAVLRPNLSKDQKMLAVQYALAQYGRPYDFDFDFNDTSSFACSELIYRAYQIATNDTWPFVMKQYESKRLFLANDLVQQYARHPENLTFIAAWLGDQNTKQARWATAEEFKNSWKLADRLVDPTLVSGRSQR